MVGIRDRKASLAALAAMALVLPGCSGVMWVNFGLLAATIAIFVATLTLGRRAEIARTGEQSGEASRS